MEERKNNITGLGIFSVPYFKYNCIKVYFHLLNSQISTFFCFVLDILWRLVSLVCCLNLALCNVQKVSILIRLLAVDCEKLV